MLGTVSYMVEDTQYMIVIIVVIIIVLLNIYIFLDIQVATGLLPILPSITSMHCRVCHDSHSVLLQIILIRVGFPIYSFS